jgi:hypothetical protein
MREKMLLSFNFGLENIILLQYFRKWNRDLLDALIDAFPVKPEPFRKKLFASFCSGTS